MEHLSYGQHLHHKKWTPLTETHTKWMGLKKEYPDHVIFLKVGKFYELFNQDADIAHQELGLLYMKGQTAHTGFPASTLQKYIHLFQQKGHTIYVTN